MINPSESDLEVEKDENNSNTIKTINIDDNEINNHNNANNKNLRDIGNENTNKDFNDFNYDKDLEEPLVDKQIIKVDNKQDGAENNQANQPIHPTQPIQINNINQVKPTSSSSYKCCYMFLGIFNVPILVLIASIIICYQPNLRVI